MTRYKFDRHAGLVDESGKIILQLVAIGCSRSFRETAGKELANKLNGIEQGKEAAVKRFPSPPERAQQLQDDLDEADARDLY